MPRPSLVVLPLLGLGLCAVMATFVDAAVQISRERPALTERAALVEQLGLTDLALFTEARYTRHPSQADRHAAFQDHPNAMDHFPTGSLVAPPRTEERRP